MQTLLCNKNHIKKKLFTFHHYGLRCSDNKHPNHRRSLWRCPKVTAEVNDTFGRAFCIWNLFLFPIHRLQNSCLRKQIYCKSWIASCTAHSDICSDLHNRRRTLSCWCSELFHCKHNLDALSMDDRRRFANICNWCVMSGNLNKRLCYCTVIWKRSIAIDKKLWRRMSVIGKNV